MESGKIKNVIIIILAALNLSFLAVIALDVNETHYAQEREKTELVSFFETNGIYIDKEDIETEQTERNCSSVCQFAVNQFSIQIPSNKKTDDKTASRHDNL